MCKSALHGFLEDLPKCEHHLHLEGCLSPRLFFHLAAKNKVAIPNAEENPAYKSQEALEKRYEHFDCLQDFLDCYNLAISVLVDATDFEQLAWEYFMHAKADGVHHAEVFFDPQAHTERGVAFSTVVDGYSAACKRAESEFGITSKLIMCFLRHLPANLAQSTLTEAIDNGCFDKGIVTGVGLDSSEVGFPPELFTEQYREAKALKLHRTAHAGEEGDTSYIKGAIDALDVERIDHGIRLQEDPELMAEVAARGIMLTVCPLSNVCLQCVKKVDELPIRKFLEAGVKFSLNSDDPAYFGGYILNNYCAVQEAFHLTISEWSGIAKVAVEGSWIDEKRRQELTKAIDVCVQKHSV